jgi:hypothetical protein
MQAVACGGAFGGDQVRAWEKGMGTPGVSRCAQPASTR